jgi:hypothetical protein
MRHDCDVNEAIQRTKQIAKTLRGQYDPFVACRELTHIGQPLPVVADEAMVRTQQELDGLLEALRTREARRTELVDHTSRPSGRRVVLWPQT